MVIRPLNIDELAMQFAQAKPFRFVRIDDFLDAEFAGQVAAATPSFQQTGRWVTRLDTTNERRKAQLTDTRRFAPPIRNLVEALQSPVFLHTLSLITGIDNLLVDERMLGGGLHQTASGGHLDVHVDFNYLPDVGLFRRLNLLLYLNQDWQASWGGELELWDRDVKHCHHSWAPILSRCVIFETSNRSFHGTTFVNCPPQTARSSISLYYYSREAPVDFADDFHGTIFKARPGELFKGKVLMPMEALARRVGYRTGQLVRNLKSRLRPAPARSSDGGPGSNPLWPRGPQLTPGSLPGAKDRADRRREKATAG